MLILQPLWIATASHSQRYGFLSHHLKWLTAADVLKLMTQAQ
jgi:hypothetical protein